MSLDAPSCRLTLEPIGVLRCAQQEKVDAPRQPAAAEGLTGVISLTPGRNFEHALEDLEGWDRIWVVFWFHHNSGWRPKVLPPRSDSGRKGLFATRSPHRPNPLGLSALRLDRVEGLDVHVRDVDLLDGTPILDIKPYVSYTDAFPDAGGGWLAADPRPDHIVRFAAEAETQLAWSAARSTLPLRERIATTLALGPAPNPYRRIKKLPGGQSRLAVQDWRVLFTAADGEIQVQRILSGYKPSQLAEDLEDPEGVLAVHRSFRAGWPVS
jgi:tRNA-Thr(GGU) m(6)t(6)A37 methyltransferase TsaA